MTLRSLAVSVSLWALALSTLSCNTTPTPTRPTVKLTLVGSDSMFALGSALARSYSESRAGVYVNIQAFNSEIGLSAPRQDTRTIGMVSRAVRPNELDHLHAVAFARDGLAVLVNKQNPINAIQHTQITQIFSGEILTWPAGPMSGKPIVVVSREQGSGTRNAFEAMLMANLRVTLTAVVMPGEAAVVDYIIRNPDAIGYASMGAVGPEVHSLAINDVHLSTQSVESGKYPFIRTFSLVTQADPHPEVKAFVDFALSPEGQAIVGQRYGRAPQ